MVTLLKGVKDGTKYIKIGFRLKFGEGMSSVHKLYH